MGIFKRASVEESDGINLEACRRAGEDRRRDHSRAMIYSLFKKRRRGPRRELDNGLGQYVDFHEPVVIILTIAITLLCVADAFFTLNIIDRGGEEVNPFMRMLLEKDVVLFFSVKFSITSICLLFTIVHKHFRILSMISGYHILYAVFMLYALLIYYELYLLDFNTTVFSFL
ncbi:MAG: DUF5658 family protein [Gammaproteobacteria bacterium]|nr:DUF5658 family protein [Gammaproteobacteria bacterium]